MQEQRGSAPAVLWAYISELLCRWADSQLLLNLWELELPSPSSDFDRLLACRYGRCHWSRLQIMRGTILPKFSAAKHLWIEVQECNRLPVVEVCRMGIQSQVRTSREYGKVGAPQLSTTQACPEQPVGI